MQKLSQRVSKIDFDELSDDTSLLAEKEISSLAINVSQTANSRKNWNSPIEISKFEDLLVSNSPKLKPFLERNSNLQTTIMILEYAELGVLNEDLVNELLSIQNIKSLPINPPLHSEEIFKEVLPLLEKIFLIKPELVVKLFSCRSGLGEPILHQYPGVGKLAIPFIKKILTSNPDFTIPIFSIKESFGSLIIENPLIFTQFVPFFEKLSDENPELLIAIFSLKNEKGMLGFTSPLVKIISFDFLENLAKKQPELFLKIASLRHNDGQLSLAPILPMFLNLGKQNPSLLVDLLKIQDDGGLPILFDVKALPEILRFIKDFDSNLIVEIFSITDRQGRTLIDDPKLFKQVIPFLESLVKINPNLLVNLLSHRNESGSVALANHEIFLSSNPILVKIPEHYLKLLCAQNKLGRTILFDLQLFMSLLPMINWFAQHFPKLTSELLTIQDILGNTILHHAPFRVHLENLIIDLEINLKAYVNKDGVSIQDFFDYTISQEWPFVPKISSEDKIPQLDQNDYVTRVKILKNKIEFLWNGLIFGDADSQLSPLLLEVNKVQYSSLQILTTLKEMISLMENETPWLGTPPAEQSEGIHRFYCKMLINFETLINKLMEQNSQIETVGFLVSVASARLEGRCATAYQSEIQQKKNEALGKRDRLTLDGVVKEASSATLQGVIELFVREGLNSDVHHMNQLMYHLKFEEEPDPLSGITLEHAKQFCSNYWNLLTIFSYFPHRLSQELAIDWLKQKTPEDFGPEYRKLAEEVKLQEIQIEINVRRSLSQILPAELMDKVVDYIRFSRANSLSFLLKSKNEATKEAFLSFMLERSKDQFPDVDFSKLIPKDKFKNFAEVEADVENFIKKLREQLSLVVSLQQTPEMSALEKMALVRKKMDIENSVILLKSRIKAIIDYCKTMDNLKINDFSVRRAIIKVKTHYEEAMKKIAHQIEESSLSISFNPAKDIPSQAIESSRQIEFNKDFMESRRKTLFRVLELEGVFTKTHP